MKEVDTNKVAEQLDAIAEAFIALSGSFRASSSGGKGASGVGKAASKPAVGKGKAAPVETDEDVTIDDVRAKLKELAASKGKEKMVEALESVGAGALADVDESQYAELIGKADELLAEEDEPPAKKPAAKKGKAKAVTQEELMEAAKELLGADKAAMQKLIKKFGKPSEAEEDSYAEYLKAIQDTMPDEDDGL